jgi:hypothetical protein
VPTIAELTHLPKEHNTPSRPPEIAPTRPLNPTNQLVAPTDQILKILLPALLLTLTTLPAMAAVIAEGKVSNGYDYQKVQKQNGTIQYMCRSTSTGKFQKHASCDGAGAKRPNKKIIRYIAKQGT